MPSTKVAATIAPDTANSKLRAIVSARLAISLFFFSFASPAFAFSPRSELEELIIAAAGSTVCSLIAIIVVLVKSNKSFLPRLLMALASPLLVFPICMGGSMATSYLVKQASDVKKDQNTVLRIQEETEAWQRNALRTAACNGDSASLTSELASDAHDQETKQRVLNECVLPRADAASLQAMLLDLRERNTGPRAHCAYLNPVLQSMDTSLLDVFAGQKMSLACPDDAYSSTDDATPFVPSWWDVVNQQHNADAVKLLNTLRYLQSHGVDMKVAIDGRSLLSIAMENSKPELILFALDAGADPYLLAKEQSTLSPLETWTLQRFSFTGMGTYSDADRKNIQSRLREMTAKEADALAHKVNDKGGLDHAKDGGAGLLSYLIKSGASLHRMNSGGNGAVNAYTRLSPALQEVLNQFNDQQLQEFICPVPGKYDDGYAVYAQAIEAENKEIISFLKQRKMPETCPKMPRANNTPE